MLTHLYVRTIQTAPLRFFCIITTIYRISVVALVFLAPQGFMCLLHCYY
jgi:hypothetical protein